MLYIQVSSCSWAAKAGNINGACAPRGDPPGKAVAGHKAQSVTDLFIYCTSLKEPDIVLALKGKGNDF